MKTDLAGVEHIVGYIPQKQNKSIFQSWQGGADGGPSGSSFSWPWQVSAVWRRRFIPSKTKHKVNTDNQV